MNQILVSKKIYVTPKVRKKKKMYKFIFILSVVAVILLSGRYGYAVYDQRKNESMAREIMENISFGKDNTTTEEKVLVVGLSENIEEVIELDERDTNNVYTAPTGTKYTVDAILNIPSLGINYPVLSETSDELLKISLNKFWGGKPNTVGNYCIVGHNYDGKDIMFGKLNRIKNGDIVELEDSTGKTLQYKVYNIFIVQPNDVACTSQLTNGQTEMTLITCADGGRTRLIVKCRAV